MSAQPQRSPGPNVGWPVLAELALRVLVVVGATAASVAGFFAFIFADFFVPIRQARCPSGSSRSRASSSRYLPSGLPSGLRSGVVGGDRRDMAYLTLMG